MFAGHHRRRIRQCTSTYYPSPGLAPTLEYSSCLVCTPSITTCSEYFAAGFSSVSNRKFGSDSIFSILSLFSHRINKHLINRVQCHRTIRLFSFERINLLSSQVLRPVNVASPQQIALLEIPVFSAHIQQIIVILSFLYIHIRHAQDIEVSVLDQQHCR